MTATTTSATSRRSPRPAIAFAVLTATLGGLLFGYDTAVISGAVDAIDANFIAPRHLAATAADTLSGLTISSALVGTVLGAAAAGTLATRLGRRPSLILAAVLFFVSALGAAWPEFLLAPVGGMGAQALTPFAIYRVLGGIGVGVASMVSPLYIAEIVPAHDRGRMVAWQQIAIIAGILIVYFVNWTIGRMGDATWLLSTGWRFMFASGAVPAALFFGLLFLVPESPRWLMQHGEAADAERVLDRLGINRPGLGDEIRASLVTPWEPLFSYGARLILIGVLLSVFQQFIGINAVLYYAPSIFKQIGASNYAALLQTVVVGAANAVFTLVAMATVDRWGRKPLMIVGALIMAAAMTALGALFQSHALGVWALAAMVVYIAGFALSWGPVVWILLSEIFPNSIKGQAMGIAVTAQWIANFAVSSSFKVLNGDPGLTARFNHGFPYYVYGAMSLLAALFVWRMLPETKGRTLEDMGALWRPGGGDGAGVGAGARAPG